MSESEASPRAMSRRDLYEAVWLRPMVKAAADYGISDVGLKKICAKHRIPVPGRGYWAKKAAGQPVKQVALRITRDSSIGTVHINGGWAARLPELVRKARTIARQVEAAPERKVEVPVVPPGEVHPILAKTAKALDRAKADKEGFVTVKGSGWLSMRIGQESRDRAITIADAFIRAADARGYQAEAAFEGLRIVVEGETLELALNEQPDQIPHIPTASELKEKERREKSGYSWYSGDPWPKYDHPPSGRLGIEIVVDPYAGLGVRRAWRDRKNRRLELLLNDVLAGLVVFATAKHNDRLAREARERQWEEEGRQWRLTEARRVLQKKQLEFLNNFGRQLDDFTRLRDLIGELEHRWPDVTDQRIIRLLSWAREHVDRLNAVISVEKIGRLIDDEQLFLPDDQIEALV